MAKIFIAALCLFFALFCYLGYEESAIWPSGSGIRTADKPEYVHERYQRSYFGERDANRLRHLHDEQAIVLLAIALCWVALAYSRHRATNKGS